MINSTLTFHLSFVISSVFILSYNYFLSVGGHGGGAPLERQPEPQLLRPAQHLQADQRGECPEPTGGSEGGGAWVPDALLTCHQLDPAVHCLQSSRGSQSHTFYVNSIILNDSNWKMLKKKWQFSVVFSEVCYFMLFVFLFQPLLTEMMERCKKLGNKWVLLKTQSDNYLQVSISALVRLNRILTGI